MFMSGRLGKDQSDNDKQKLMAAQLKTSEFDEVERWVNRCRKKVATLKYLLNGCHLNGHLLTIVGQAEQLELEIEGAVSKANAVMASKSRRQLPIFCDTTVTLSSLHVAVDRLMLEHALLRGQIETWRAGCFQFATALQTFNAQYEQLTQYGQNQILQLLVDFCNAYADESPPVSFTSVYQQKGDMERISKHILAFKDDVKHLVRSGRALKLMATQNSANDLRLIDLKLADLHSRIKEIGDWLVKQQNVLRSAELSAKQFNGLWRDLLAWIDATLSELDELRFNYRDEASLGLRALHLAQQRVKLEKQTRLIRCVRFADDLAKTAKQSGNASDRQLLEWQTATLKGRFSDLETAIDGQEADFIRSQKEDFHVRTIIGRCKQAIAEAQSYLAGFHSREKKEKNCTGRPANLKDELDLVALMRKKIDDLLDESSPMTNIVGLQKVDSRLADCYESQLLLLSRSLGERHDALSQEFEAMGDYVKAYTRCRMLVDETFNFIEKEITCFGDESIAKMQKQYERVVNAQSSIPRLDDVRPGVKTGTKDQMARLKDDIAQLKATIECHSKRRQQAKNLFDAVKYQMAINRSRFQEIVGSLPASKLPREVSLKVKAPFLEDISLTKQRLLNLVSTSSGKQHVRLQRSMSVGSRNSAQKAVNRQNDGLEALYKYLELNEATEARRLYLECIRYGSKFS